MLLGAVVRDITDPFFAGAVEALSVAAMGRGYNLVLGHARGRADEALALTAVLETRHCDAIVLLGDLQDQPRLLADLADLVVPVVGLWQGSSPLEVSTVDVDNDASAEASVVEVRGPDAVGALYRIARALSDMRLDIRHAKVLTLGHEIVDSFYVVDMHGKKLTDADRISELERAVLFELSRLR